MRAHEGLADQDGGDVLLVDAMWAQLLCLDHDARADVLATLLAVAGVAYDRILGTRVAVLEAMGRLNLVDSFLDAAQDMSGLLERRQ